MGRGKYSEESDNFKGKLLVSILIMAVLAAATGVLVITAPAQEGDPTTGESGFTMPGDDNVTTVYDPTEPTAPPEDNGYPYDELYVEPVIHSVTPLFFGSPSRWANDISLPMGTSVLVELRIISEGIEDGDFDITWSSDNDAIFDVVPTTDPSWRFATITPAGLGTTRLRITVDDFPEIVYDVRIVRP
jgi:hypothetical protein